MSHSSDESSGADPRVGWLAAAFLAATWLACGPRDARVGAGVATTLDGGDAGDGAAMSPIFSAEMASNDGVWGVVESLPGAQVVFGTSATGTDTHDGQVAVLLFPGGGADPNATVAGAGAGAGITSSQSFQYGIFRARVRWTTTCAPDEELISAVTLRTADGQERDQNGNGIGDLRRLDVQVPCSTPSFVVLSAWSDYQKDALGAETFRKRSHAVDTATGDVYDTVAEGEVAFAKTGRSADLVHPGFPDPTLFYDLGMAWQPDHVRFFMTLDGREVTLWDLAAPAYVPVVPLSIGFQLWHPAAHWLPSTTPASVPAFEGVFAVDSAAWFSG